MKCYNCGYTTVPTDHAQEECPECHHLYQNVCKHIESESFSGKQRCKGCKLALPVKS